MPDHAAPQQPGPALAGGPLPDHRRSPEAVLLDAIRAGDHLALAEAWQRTATAAHAVARRLTGPADLEGILHRLYTELWQSPPRDEPLERWARARCFALCVESLHAQGRAPAAPSVCVLLPDLPRPRPAALDPVERVLSALPEPAVRALVRAHDQGLPTWTHPEPDAEAALRLALAALAGAPEHAGARPADAPPLCDLALGLLDVTQAEALQDLLLDTPALAEQARLLKRGSRRMEGLPPAPDLGPRILLAVVAGVPDVAPSLVAAAPGAFADLFREDEVVITVARQAAAEASVRRGGRDEDTGPIAVIDPPATAVFDDDALDGWSDGVAFGGSLADQPDHEAPEPEPLRQPRHQPRASSPPSPRRGIGLLLVGTALGMLVGALTLVLR